MKYTFESYEKTEILRGHLNLGGENKSGERIDVNSLYLERNGKPWLPVMGEYQFARGHQEDWYRELCKMKAGGVTIVATYLFWNYHEETEGEFDFTGDRDLRTFVLDAKKAGLEVFLRIGPWIHGEVRNGGFPDWIEKPPYETRSNQPAYMEKVRIVYTKYYEQVSDLFYQDGGPIIGIQLENEISNADHIDALKKMALDIGFKVPLWTATGWSGVYGSELPVKEVLPVFGGYPDMPWDDRLEKLPPSVHYAFSKQRNDTLIGADLTTQKYTSHWRLPVELYPYATCELGTGNQASHHRRPIITGQDIYALSLVKFGSGNNLIGYYPFHGGTNKIGKYSTLQESKESGYPNDYPVLQYDFQAALSEFGEVREQYRLLNLLHLFACDFGEMIAPMEAVMSKNEVSADNFSGLRYAMRTDGTGGFVFVNQYQREAVLTDIEDAVIDTGTVTFPAMTIRNGMSFILPFELPMENEKITWATMQLLCKEGSAYFFMIIPDLDPRMKFEDGTIYAAPTDRIHRYVKGECTIVTVPMQDALYMRRLGQRICIGHGVDLYTDGVDVLSAEEGDYSYMVWNGNEFEQRFISNRSHPARLSRTECKEPFAVPYPYELQIGGERKLTWNKLEVTTPEGFVEILADYDCAQIYADGELVADDFWYDMPWRIPAKLLYGKESYLVMSEKRDDFYVTQIQKGNDMEFKTPFTDGTFLLGVNYWASHAGTNMWREWNEEVIEDDLCRLSDAGIRLIRIFPLWSDFQPIKKIYGSRSEITYENDEPLPFTEEGRAGLDPVMLDRFGRFCQIAEKHGMKMIISLITGWMSGRCYVPRLFEEMDALIDSRSLKWQIRFVQYMVRHFKKEASIVAWELGNECNCIGTETPDEAYVWAKTITMAVKEIDSERPMISGMHGLGPEAKFTPEMLGEIDDLLTTHPYPLFTSSCNTDPMTKMKSALHATAESVMYAGLGGKACFVEEAGALGTMMANDENVARYFTASAMSAWAHHLRAYLWWCANEQLNLTHAPYDWCHVERELGVFYDNKQPKPLLHAMTTLQNYVDHFPCKLGEPLVDAVCILTQGQQHWPIAYGTFLLAKQAGLDLRFCYCDDEIPEASVYLMPSVTGLTSITGRAMNTVLERVEKGATLYLSLNDALLSSFEKMTGVRPNYRMQQPHTDQLRFVEGGKYAENLQASAPISMNLTATFAKVIVETEDGNPALTKNDYGRGTVWYCNYPIELYTGTTPRATEEPLYRLYEVMNLKSPEKTVSKSDPFVGLTEHITDCNSRVVVAINYEPERRSVIITLGEEWKIVEFLPLGESKLTKQKGCEIQLDMEANSGVSLIIAK